MIFPKVNVTQISANELLLTDVTPDYSYLYTGGFGFPNPERNLIRKVSVIITVGSQSFEIEQDYDAITGETILDSTDLPYDQFYKPDTSDCKECHSNQDIVKGNGNSIASWPSGCVTLEYRIKYFDQNTGTLACSEKYKVNLVLYFTQEQKLIHLFEKFPFNEYGCDTKRTDNMRDLVFAWERLQNIGRFQNCSCECISDVIKSVDIFLSKIEL